MKPPAHLPVLRDTAFAPRTDPLCLGREWGRWAGCAAARVYTDVEEEYFAIRNAATAFDLSPLTKYRVHGPHAARYLDRLTIRSVARLGAGEVAYTAWCDDDGKVLDDGTVFRLDDGTYRLCAQERHLDWLLDAAVGFDVIVEDESAALAALAVQGPRACAVLAGLGFDRIEWLAPFEHRVHAVDGHPVLVSRTGFTGDLGYELFCERAAALALWDRVFEAGAPHGLRAIGTAALDLARLEAGFIVAGRDFVPAAQALRPSRRRSPYELGLGWLVDLDKGEFNGRGALLAERVRGSRWRLVGLDVEGPRPAVDGLVLAGWPRREVGHVTSAAWAPSAKRNVALASVRRTHGWLTRGSLAGGASGGPLLRVEVHTRKELEWERRIARARVVARPFFDPPRRRAVPAPGC